VTEVVEKLSEKRNELIGRSEIVLLISSGGGTPSRAETLEAVSKYLGIDKDRLALVNIMPRYGSPEATVTVHKYDTPATLRLFEPRYRLVRQGIEQKK